MRILGGGREVVALVAPGSVADLKELLKEECSRLRLGMDSHIDYIPAKKNPYFKGRGDIEGYAIIFWWYDIRVTMFARIEGSAENRKYFSELDLVCLHGNCAHGMITIAKGKDLSKLGKIMTALEKALLH